MEDEKKIGLIYPDLSYQIVGSAYEVFNQLGPGLREKIYENAIALEFGKRGIKFRRQFYVPVRYADERVGSYFLDFLVDEKIVVELKLGDHFSRQEIQQVGEYLRKLGFLLALIIKFTSNGVRQKRVLHPDQLTKI